MDTKETKIVENVQAEIPSKDGNNNSRRGDFRKNARKPSSAQRAGRVKPEFDQK